MLKSIQEPNEWEFFQMLEKTGMVCKCRPDKKRHCRRDKNSPGCIQMRIVLDTRHHIRRIFRRATTAVHRTSLQWRFWSVRLPTSSKNTRKRIREKFCSYDSCCCMICAFLCTMLRFGLKRTIFWFLSKKPKEHAFMGKIAAWAFGKTWNQKSRSKASG